MSKSHVPAERGWHVVTIVRERGALCIRDIHKVTHWDRFNHPMQNGKSLFFDPDDVNHVLYVSYLLDPQGRLLGRDREVIANSVLELQEQHKRWRENGGPYGHTMPPAGFDIQNTHAGQFELICKAGDVHQSCGSFRTRAEAVEVALGMSRQSA
jgi:hypothetical protein